MNHPQSLWAITHHEPSLIIIVCHVISKRSLIVHWMQNKGRPTNTWMIINSDVRQDPIVNLRWYQPVNRVAADVPVPDSHGFFHHHKCLDLEKAAVVDTSVYMHASKVGISANSYIIPYVYPLSNVPCVNYMLYDWQELYHHQWRSWNHRAGYDQTTRNGWLTIYLTWIDGVTIDDVDIIN